MPENLSSDDTSSLKERAITAVLERFDFDAVHQAMMALGWTWGVPFSATETEIPSVPRLREQATDLLSQVWDDNEPDLVSSIGGFQAGRTESSLHLQFILRSAHLDMRPHAADPAISPTEKALFEAAKHLAKTERGRLAISGIRSMMDQSYSLDAGNIQAVMTLLSGFYGSLTGTASEAVNEHLEAQ